MKSASPIRLLFLECLAGLLLCLPGSAAVSIVDTFDQGGFYISPARGNILEQVDVPFGPGRLVGFKPGAPGTEIDRSSCHLNNSTGNLTYFVSGTSPDSNFPLGLNLVYGGGGAVHSLQGYTEFIRGFSQLSGVGTLYVELGASNGLLGAHRVDLIGSGDVHYPVSGVWANPGHTLDSFSALRFVFEARSPEFSFTLDEIRLIPEPSAAVLVVVAGVGLLTGRRRSVRED